MTGPIDSAKIALNFVRFTGLRYKCPLCGGRFRKLREANGRDLSECPRCLSRERHRYMWMYFQRNQKLLAHTRKLLHIAPDAGLGRRLRTTAGISYIGADLDPLEDQVKIDITNIEYPDGSFDAVICNHVLEHVPEAQQALAELRRILAPEGWAIITVPIKGQDTVEDLAITNPQQRRALYGQEDHVRQYGRDFYDDLRKAGFEVEVESIINTISADDRHRFGLDYHSDGSSADPSVWEIPICRPA